MSIQLLVHFIIVLCVSFCLSGAATERSYPTSKVRAAAKRTYPTSKVRSSGCALLEQP